MKKIILAIRIIFLMSLFLLVGCIEQTHKDNDIANNHFETAFLGDWLNNTSSSYGELWSFHTNDTLKITVTWGIEDNPIVLTYWYHYEVDEDTLCLTSIDELPDSPNYYYQCHGFTFSENMNHLTLSDNGIITFEFNKI